MNIDDDLVPNRIFVGNLPPEVNDATLRHIFGGGTSRINVSSSSAGTANLTPGQLNSTSPPNTYNLVGSALNTLQTPVSNVTATSKPIRPKAQLPHNNAVAAAANFANHAASINSTAAVVLDGSGNRGHHHHHQMPESHQAAYDGHQHSQPTASMPIPIQQPSAGYYAQSGGLQHQAGAYYAPMLAPLDPNPPSSMYRMGGPHSVGATSAECILNPASMSPQLPMAPHTFTSAHYYAANTQDNQPDYTKPSNYMGTYYQQPDAAQQHEIPDMARSPADSDDDSVPNRIFVGNLPPEVNDATLRHIFEQVIQVKSGSEMIVDSRVIFDPIYRRSKGFGFISFERDSNVLVALSQDVIFHGSKLNVQRATKRQTPPPSMPPLRHNFHSRYHHQPTMPTRFGEDVYEDKAYARELRAASHKLGIMRQALHNNDRDREEHRYEEIHDIFEEFEEEADTTKTSWEYQ